MKLLELFDTKTEIEVQIKSPTQCKMSFFVDNTEYTFKAYENEDEDKQGHPIWNISFQGDQGGKAAFGITNAGNAPQVLAMVVQCIKKWLSMYPSVYIFFFSAKTTEPSRVKLYNRMARALITPGWRMYKEMSKTGQLFYFTKDRG